MASKEETTRTLIDLTHGGEDAAAKLIPIVHEKLKAIAARYMKQERRDHTLQASALLNEAYVRLFDEKQLNWEGKAHFVALAAEAMRRILVDHARRRAAAKRGGGWGKVPLDAKLAESEAKDAVDLIAVDDALEELKKLHARQARVVELRYFGGLSVKETACALAISERTVNHDWDFARLWLRQWLDR